MAFHLPKVREALNVFASLCHPDSVASVYTFNDTVLNVVETSNIKTLDWNTLSQANGSTNFEAVLQLLDRIEGNQDVILLSDGMPTSGTITSVNKQSIENLFKAFDPIAKKCISKKLQVHTLA